MIALRHHRALRDGTGDALTRAVAGRILAGEGAARPAAHDCAGRSVPSPAPCGLTTLGRPGRVGPRSRASRCPFLAPDRHGHGARGRRTGSV
ncbi:hypothetical protein ACFPN0_27200 [Kitasatospora cinereorecta]